MKSHARKTRLTPAILNLTVGIHLALAHHGALPVAAIYVLVWLLKKGVFYLSNEMAPNKYKHDEDLFPALSVFEGSREQR